MRTVRWRVRERTDDEGALASATPSQFECHVTGSYESRASERGPNVPRVPRAMSVRTAVWSQVRSSDDGAVQDRNAEASA